MPIITEIVATPQRPDRLCLEVDGRSFATVSVETVRRLGLRVGAVLGEEGAGAVEHDAQLLRVYDRALNLLAFRARSARELSRQLVRKGEPAPIVESVVQRLLAVGLLNDGEYARQYARSKVIGSGFSRRRVEHELLKRGVAREVAERAISAVLDDEEVDEDATIERAARKKLRTLSSADPSTRRRRLYAYLARRGFDAEEIQRAMTRVLGGDAASAEAEEQQPGAAGEG